MIGSCIFVGTGYNLHVVIPIIARIKRIIITSVFDRYQGPLFIKRPTIDMNFLGWCTLGVSHDCTKTLWQLVQVSVNLYVIPAGPVVFRKALVSSPIEFRNFREFHQFCWRCLSCACDRRAWEGCASLAFSSPTYPLSLLTHGVP